MSQGRRGDGLRASLCWCSLQNKIWPIPTHDHEERLLEKQKKKKEKKKQSLITIRQARGAAGKGYTIGETENGEWRTPKDDLPAW
jgi:hypothetical protein